MSAQTIEELREVAAALSGALQLASKENDLLKRQVEVLARRIERLNRKGYACEICEVTVSELHCVQRCAELVKSWSLEQAKKGGGA